MERLTSNIPWHKANKHLSHELGYSFVWQRLNEIENILGDDYDLDYLQDMERKVSELTFRAEAAEAKCSTLEKRIKEYAEALNPKYAELEGKLYALPVRHGYWMDVSLTGLSSWSATCSVCNTRNDIPPITEANYCPSCGAKMDLMQLTEMVLECPEDGLEQNEPSEKQYDFLMRRFERVE